MHQTVPFFCKAFFSLAVLFLIGKVTAQPTITSFTPTSGAVGTSVIITGTNFNGTSANNIVFFGAVKATVTAATATSLTVTVPVGATYKPISVLNITTGLTGYSSASFIPTFTNPFGTGIPSYFYGTKVDFTVGTFPRSVAIGDLDGDGKADVAVANANVSTVSVFRNISTAGAITASSLAAKVDFTTGTSPRSVAIGDLDGDGKPELVVANESVSTVSVYHNTSASGTLDATSFAAKVDFVTAGTPVFVAIGDVDGDGKPELLTANSNAASVSVLLNTTIMGVISATSFAAKVDFSVGLTPYSVALRDIDGDGNPDMVTANAAGTANTVSVRRNTASLGTITATSFAVKVDFPTNLTPRSVAIGDIDGDGKLDIVVGNAEPTSTTLSVLLNTSTSGTVSFATKVDFTTGISPYAVALGDLDGDGKIDVVATNLNSNTLSVLRNISTPGSANLTAKVDFTTALGPDAVAIGDLDGDGIPEIVVSNLNSTSISVFQINLSVVPITLTDVKAYQQNNGVQIEWTTQQENNIYGYEVEKSTNGQQFSTFGSVKANNSSAIVNYKLFDPNPSYGANFYRIKIIEAGHVVYSRILKINISNGAEDIVTIYPNPVKGNTISLQLNLRKGIYKIGLTNKFGQQILNQTINHAGGSAAQSIELSKALPAGTYQLTLNGAGLKIIKQVIKD